MAEKFAHWAVEHYPEQDGFKVDITITFETAKAVLTMDLDTKESKQDFSYMMRALPQILTHAMQEVVARHETRDLDQQLQALLDPETD